jgi:SAM-dependent methyltransferase
MTENHANTTKTHIEHSEPSQLASELKQKFQQDSDGIFISECNGYWSNLDKAENRILIDTLKEKPAKAALRQHYPTLEDIIYSPKRQAGLELLRLNGDETCIDYGCMWGALTIPLAKRTKYVLGIDQTLDSLRFLKARTIEENVPNIDLLHHDIREMPILSHKADVAVVNGVLEWVPEYGDIELKSYYGRRRQKRYAANPLCQQRDFLERVLSNLKEGGRLYLAIENRYDFKMFCGAKDPHANLLFTTILPRKASDLISRVALNRPYVNWNYSFDGIHRLLKAAGFSEVERYMCFPDYRYPERIIPYDNGLAAFEPTISARNFQGRRTLKRILARAAERLLFSVLRLKFIAPSIIAIAYK